VAQVQSDLCTERAIIENQIPMHVDKDVFYISRIGLSPEVLESENIVIFRCFDPVWGRGQRSNRVVQQCSQFYGIDWYFFEVLKKNGMRRRLSVRI
jgi:hypothetical protein